MSQGRQRKWWGWGWYDYRVSPKDMAPQLRLLKQAFGIDVSQLSFKPPQLDTIQLRRSRCDQIPDSIASFCTTEKLARIIHSYGSSTADILRRLAKQFGNPPDLVAMPADEGDLHHLMRVCEEKQWALIPYGGGTSVVGGVEPCTDTRYKAVVVASLVKFNKLLAIDKQSMSVHVQAGVFGPMLESMLKPHGLTLRHFPQSFEFSTVGGWIVTRAGGHFASGKTHIDDFVESVRLLAPRADETSLGSTQLQENAAIMDTVKSRVPASGAGPNPNSLVLGSEGTLGVVTDAWLRVQHRTVAKAEATIMFDSFLQGANAVRGVMQAGLLPSNCRLIDPMEALLNGVADGSCAALILAFEASSDSVAKTLDVLLDAAIAIAVAHQGRVKQRQFKKYQQMSQVDGSSDSAAETWKASFVRAPYMRDELLGRGVIAETFESAVSWANFEKFHRQVQDAVMGVIKREAGGRGLCTCRFTHVYTDGPAPYFTVILAPFPQSVYDAIPRGSALPSHRFLEMLAIWNKVKHAASMAIVEAGGTITHHHAVGKDHAPYWHQEASPVYVQTLSAAKRHLDPCSIMNPGVLFGQDGMTLPSAPLANQQGLSTGVLMSRL